MENSKNVYFAITYYQIVYAILHSQQTKQKSKLFVSTDYLNMSDELYERLSESSFFEEVVFFTEKDIRDEIFTFIEKEKDFKIAGEGLRNKIDDYYKEIIKLEDNDIIYVFNIKQIFYGYIYNLPNKMILIEDGYRSIKQQLKIHKFKGRYTLLEKFEGSYFPKTTIEDEKFKKFIINDIKDTKDLNLNLDVEEFNYVKMFNNLSNEKLNELLDIFNMNEEYFEDDEDVVLVLTQPLARAQYCSILQQYLVYKRLINQLKAEGSKVIIKLHPADKNIYSPLESKNVEVINTPYPVDLMLFKNKNIKKVISYGSTATDIMEDKVECIKIFDKEHFSHQDVSTHIKQYIKNVRLNILVSGKCYVSDNVIKKANYQNIYITITKYNTDNIYDTQKYALDNDFDYFIYDELGSKYTLDFFNNLYKVIKGKIVSIYSFTCMYLYNGREYIQESIAYNRFLKFSFFDKLVKSNIELSDNTIDSMQSCMLKNDSKSYLIKTVVKTDYKKAEKIFIGVDDAYKLIEKCNKMDLADNQINLLSQNINMNVIGTSLICINADKVQALQEYLYNIPKEQLVELMYRTNLTYVNSKVEVIKGSKYQKNTPKKVMKKVAKKILRIN